jgi:hypothetical protein
MGNLEREEPLRHLGFRVKESFQQEINIFAISIVREPDRHALQDV